MRFWFSWALFLFACGDAGAGDGGTSDGGLDAPLDVAPRADAGPPDSGARCESDAGVVTISACNGHPQLCDRAFDEVAYPTTHNAMSSAEEEWVAPNQNLRLWQQLEDGIRAFMLDVHPADDGTPMLCHAFCRLGQRPLVEGLRDLRLFLECHPTEVLSIIFESNVPESAIEEAFRESGLLRYVHPQAVGAPWPTLRTLIEADERMVVFTADRAASLPWHLYSYDFAWENPYAARMPSDLSCAEDRGSRTNSLWIFNHFLTAPLPSEMLAEMINPDPFFTEQVARCRADAGGDLPNFVTVDFYDVGDLLAVVDALNGL